MKIGYARVSTAEQSLDLQLKALKEAGCDRIYQDHGISGMRFDRPGYGKAMRALKEGDTLVVWRLDRLARSMLDLTDTVTALHNRGIGFRSLCEYFDLGTPVGDFMLHILSAMAHFERALIVERTRAGMAAAKARGVQIGRPPAMDGETFREALFLINRGLSVPATAAQIGVGKSTLYRYLSEISA